MPPRRDTSSAKPLPKGGGETHLSGASQSADQPSHNTEAEAGFNLGDDIQSKQINDIKIKAADTPKGKEKSISRIKGKCTDSNQRNAEKRDKLLNNPRRSSRPRRPAWKTLEMGNSEMVKCHPKFQKMKSESDLTQQRKSQTIVHSKCISSASCSQIPPPKGDIHQKKSEKPHHQSKISPYSISLIANPDYSKHARQSKKTGKFRCSPTSLRRSPGGAKERAKRYISRKRKRRAVELVGKYRKKKLRSNQATGDDLWEGFPFNLQMPRYKSEQKPVQSDSQTEGLQGAQEEAFSEIVKQENTAADDVQEEQEKVRISENLHGKSPDNANDLTFTITKEKKRKRRHRKRKKQHRLSLKSEQSMGSDPAKVKETHRSGTKTFISTTPKDKAREADIHHPGNDLEATTSKSQHHSQIISKSRKKYPDPTQYQGDRRAGFSYDRADSKGKKEEANTNSIAITKNPQPAFSQNKKTKQKLKKKVKFSLVDTTAGTTEVGDKNVSPVPSIKLTVKKTERVNKDGNDDHTYRVVVTGMNSHKQVDETTKKSGKVQREKKARPEHEHTTNTDEPSTRGEHSTNSDEHTKKALPEATPIDTKKPKEEILSSQVDRSSDDYYYKLLSDPNNKRPTQHPIRIKLERSNDSQRSRGEIKSNQADKKVEDLCAPLDESRNLSVPNYKLNIPTGVDASIGEATIAAVTQADEKPVSGKNAPTLKNVNETALSSDDSLFSPEDEEADDESDCEGKEIKHKQKKCTKTKSTLKVKLPSIRFAMEGNRRERTLNEVSSDEEGALSTKISSSSNTEKAHPSPSPILKQCIRTTPKKAKCQNSSTDPKLKCTNAPLMEKSRKDCTDWRLLSPGSKHRNVRRVSSEGKISSTQMASPPHPSTSERNKRAPSFGSRMCGSSTSETKQRGLPTSSRPVTRRQSLESNSESLLEGLLQVSPKKQVPTAHSHLFDDKRLGIHACALWSSGNRRHYQMKHPDASSEDLDKMMRDAWEKLSKKEKLQYYKRASNATTDQKKSKSSTTANLKKAVAPLSEPKLSAPQKNTSKPPRPPQDDFYSLSATRQEDILLHKLRHFQSTLSPYHYNKFLYEFITSFKRSVRSFRNRKAAWLDDPIERGFQYANLVAEVQQHKQFLSYKHHKLQYDDKLWKLITGAPVKFDDSTHSERLTLVLEAIEEVEQNMRRNPTQISYEEHGRGEPNLVSTCLCGSEMERRAVQERAEDLKHSCSTSGTTKVRIDNRDIIIPRIAIDSGLNQQLLSEFDHSVPLQELEAEDVDGFLDDLVTIVPEKADEDLHYQDYQIPRASTPLDEIPRASTPLDEIPRPSTPLDEIPRPSTLLDEIPRPSTPLDEIPRPSTPLDEIPRPSTPLDEIPRPSTPLDEIPRPSTPLDEIPRPSTSMDEVSRDSTLLDEESSGCAPLDGEPKISKSIDEVHKVSKSLDKTSVSTPLGEGTKISTALSGMPKPQESGPTISKTLNVAQRISKRQEQIPRMSPPVVAGIAELPPTPLEEAWDATYRCIHGIEKCCPLDSPSCILSSLLVDKMMTTRP